MDDKTVITIVAMLCLTALEAVALAMGLDGAMLLSVAGMLAALGGVAGTLRILEARQPPTG